MRAFPALCARLRWPAAVAVTGTLLYLAYWQLASRGTWVDSDGAVNALQAWDMLHGNLLLRGWALADVSFYTTDMPQILLAEAVHGLGTGVVPAASALSYTLIVLLVAWLARGTARGAAGIVRALAAAGVMLAPGVGDATGVLLGSPDHLATAVPLLLTWLVLDRAESGAESRAETQSETSRRRAAVPTVVAVLLTWTAIGDPLAAVVGALPLGAVSIVRAYRAARLRGEPYRYDLWLAAAAGLSVPAAVGLTRLIGLAGGWTATPVRTTFAPVGALAHNAAIAFEGLLQLFGADFFSHQMGLSTVFAVVHLAGAALAVWALWLAVRGFAAQGRAVQVITVGIAANMAAYTLMGYGGHLSNTREIAPVLPYAAVLAGRLAADRIRAMRLTPVAAAVLGAYCLMLAFGTAQPPVAGPAPGLASWLSAHGLTEGLADYWHANVATLESHDQVRVRAVVVDGDRLRAQSYWDAKRTWYDPAAHRATFAVSLGRSEHWRDQPLLRLMAARAGRPEHVYQFRHYTIAVWPRNLLSRLHLARWAGEPRTPVRSANLSPGPFWTSQGD